MLAMVWDERMGVVECVYYFPSWVSSIAKSSSIPPIESRSRHIPYVRLVLLGMELDVRWVQRVVDDPANLAFLKRRLRRQVDGCLYWGRLCPHRLLLGFQQAVPCYFVA
jgi:hypothetical protein